MPWKVSRPEFTPNKERFELPHGQGIFSYGSDNAVGIHENIHPQHAPDPIRQGDTPSRPARATIAVMALGTFGQWGVDDFIPYAKHEYAKMGVAHTNFAAHDFNQGVGTRPNIERPAAMAYGSLFTLAPSGGPLTLGI